MSCNGCRALRKGCRQDCILRPSLQWIKSSQSQANAILFLAKFYGRAGVINLINSGPTHLHHVILESLLFEACGRIIDPVQGSVGLMNSGKWSQCQAAVAAVLRGSPLVIPSSGVVDDSYSPGDGGRSIKPVQGDDVRHLSKDRSSAAPVAGLRRVKTRSRLKRSAKRHVDSTVADVSNDSETKFTITGWDHGKNFDDDEMKRASSHDSLLSVQTIEPDLMNRNEPVREVKPVPFGENETGPDLTLSLNPLWHTYRSIVIDISEF
ncbi:LOB domain-containing protein 42-like [Primulina tabacum]|uniref:LOB domain-containing protein 42-like n=1 Tax=Primulina tabacum TaxID=48773 RepID=UPI003F5AB513